MMKEVVYNLSYYDILSLSSDERVILLSKFYELINDIPDSLYSHHKKLGDMLMESEFYYDERISNYLFPGEKVLYYPNIKHIKSVKPFTCQVSSERFDSGNECVVFKPFIYLPIKKESYVCKRFKAYYYYENFFPKTLIEFEDFYSKVNNSYELGLDDYYNFASNIGGSISLRKLKR